MQPMSDQDVPEIQKKLERLVDLQEESASQVRELVASGHPMNSKFFRHISDCAEGVAAFLRECDPGFESLEGTVFGSRLVRVVAERLGLAILGRNEQTASFFSQWGKKNQWLTYEPSAELTAELLLSDSKMVVDDVVLSARQGRALRILLPDPACPILLQTPKGKQRVKFLTAHLDRSFVSAGSAEEPQLKYVEGAANFVSFATEIKTYIRAATEVLAREARDPVSIVIGLHTGFGSSAWTSLELGAVTSDAVGSDPLEGDRGAEETDERALMLARRVVSSMLHYLRGTELPEKWESPDEVAHAHLRALRSGSGSGGKLIPLASRWTSGEAALGTIRQSVALGDFAVAGPERDRAVTFEGPTCSESEDLAAGGTSSLSN